MNFVKVLTCSSLLGLALSGPWSKFSVTNLISSFTQYLQLCLTKQELRLTPKANKWSTQTMTLCQQLHPTVYQLITRLALNPYQRVWPQPQLLRCSPPQCHLPEGQKKSLRPLSHFLLKKMAKRTIAIKGSTSNPAPLADDNTDSTH